MLVPLDLSRSATAGKPHPVQFHRMYTAENDARNHQRHGSQHYTVEDEEEVRQQVPQSEATHIFFGGSEEAGGNGQITQKFSQHRHRSKLYRLDNLAENTAYGCIYVTSYAKLNV